MKLRAPTKEELEVISEISLASYRAICVSEGGTWVIAYKPVIFGMRVIVFRLSEASIALDYCAANQPEFAMELAATIQVIMKALPEQISSNELYALMPKWSVRPINKDPCWDKLKDMASRLSSLP